MSLPLDPKEREAFDAAYARTHDVDMRITTAVHMWNAAVTFAKQFPGHDHDMALESCVMDFGDRGITTAIFNRAWRTATRLADIERLNTKLEGSGYRVNDIVEGRTSCAEPSEPRVTGPHEDE